MSVAPDPDKLVMLAETVDITGGAVLQTVTEVDAIATERMVWIDAIARVNNSDLRQHVQLFMSSDRAVEIAVNIIQAAGRAEGKGGTT